VNSLNILVLIASLAVLLFQTILITSVGQKLYVSLHTLELSLAFTTWSRALITWYSIFFYELIAYHFFDVCMKLHCVKCCFTIHTGWCLPVNI